MTNVWLQHRDKIAGGWKCISYEMFTGNPPNEKLVAKPHGEQPMGMSQVSLNGYLSAHLAVPDRMKVQDPNVRWATHSDAEIAHVARGLSMYCGYFELFEDERGLYWKTKVDIASDPTRIGGYQLRRLRYFEENGEAFMILKPMQNFYTEDGTEARAVLKWQKFESARPS